jgi:YHS domain-containing protein
MIDFFIKYGAINRQKKASNFRSHPSLRQKHLGGGNLMAMQIDPVCGMQVDDRTALAKSQYQGTNYFFCCDDCKHQFDQQPEQYVGAQQSSGQAQGGSNR